MATSFSTLTPFLSILLLSIPSVLGASHHHTVAPAPAHVDCSTLILNMADCLSFVSAGGTDAKPASSCCNGLKTVIKTNAECLCGSNLKCGDIPSPSPYHLTTSSVSLGVTLNMTKAATLPAACKLHAPSIAACGLSVTPTMAPGGAAVAAGPDIRFLAPNPSPGNDGSSLIPISFTTVLNAIFFVLFLPRV
ncbi:hypothetical protein N665_0471s0007 [Sinapis alba]|nr:hypothetical protein N665_0471s0007 [Sinapis alba]